MRKKIILFGAGLVLAVGAFTTYSYVTGASLFSRKPASVAETQQVYLDPAEADVDHPTYEIRDKDMRLQYLLTARMARPLGKGRYQLFDPRATYYTKDGNLLVVTADGGMIEIDQLGGRLGQLNGRLDQIEGRQSRLTLKGGKLSQNVVLTIGPQDSFASGVSELQPRQIQARFANDVDFNYGDRTLESHGPIRVRGDRVAFDGENMTLLFNNDQKRIEYLRIEPSAAGGKITIRDIDMEGENDNLGFSGSKKTSSRTAVASSAGGSKPAAASSHMPPPSQSVASGEAKAAANNKPVAAPTAYRLAFGRDVKAVIGDRTLTSDQMFVIFQAAAADFDSQKRTETEPPVRPAPAAPTAASPRAAAPAAGAPAAPAAPTAKSEDLVITWSGPMELVPISAADAQLTGPKDRIFEAVSHQGRPVLMTIGDAQRLAAGKIHFQAATQHVVMEPGELPQVELSDPKLGKLVCRGIDFDRLGNTVQIIGPGRLEAAPDALQQADEKSATSPAQPIIATWTRTLKVALAKVPDLKQSGKSTLIVRHALIEGDVDVRDPAKWWIHADTLDATVADAPKGATGRQQRLEHLLATGNVQAQSFRNGAPGGHEQPDAIQGQRLELLTARPAPQALPEPDRLLVDGDVQAVSYQIDKKDPAHLLKSRIDTPKLMVRLEPRNAGSVPAKDDALGNLNVKELQAVNGVRVEMELHNSQPVVATADQLFADAKANTATLLGLKGAGNAAQPARLQRGEDGIAGMEIRLDRATQSIAIPGPGQFAFLQQGKKQEGKPAEIYPVVVTWANSMAYNGQQRRGEFDGNVHARLVGKSDQTSELETDNLSVLLAASGSVGGDLADAGAKGLAELRALGNVRVTGNTLDEKGTPLTGMLLRDVRVLTYSDTSKLLTIAGPGNMLLEDSRPTAKSDNKAQPTLAGSGSRGKTAFHWEEGLTYDGKTGEILLKKNIRMVHQPLEPIRVAAPGSKPEKNPSAKGGSVISQITLDCQSVLATLDNAKENTSNPVTFGGGENVKLSKVTAVGSEKALATLWMDQTTLIAPELEFNAIKNQAIARGKDDDVARASSPEWGIMSAEEILWDMTKDPNKKDEAFTLRRPRISGR